MQRALVVAIGCVLGEPGLAQVNPEFDALVHNESTVEFGMCYVDEDSYRFGRYRGLQQQGLYAVLGLEWLQRAPHDSEVPVYTWVSARNLGLSNRTIEFEHGRQGVYEVRASYEQLPMYRSDSGSTIFSGVGGNRLTLPGNWVAAQNTAGMTALVNSLQPVNIDHQRRRFGAGLDYLFAHGWTLTSNVRHERKDGLKTTGAVIGNSGGNPRAVILPEPVDYETSEVEVGLGYFDPVKQLEFRYLVSLFDDNEDRLAWQNPFAAINGWVSAAGYPNGFGQLALPPDNQFHQLSVLGGYNWDSGIRLSADLAVGRMTQDEAFLPYTINPTLANSITQPLPRASLDGRIDTTVANVRLTGMLGERFNWTLGGRFDDRDNQTPRAEYVYIGGDSNNQNVAANSSFRRFNEPLSYRDAKVKLDLGYRLAQRTRLTGSLERRSTERTYSEREQADENTARIALRHASAEWLTSSIRYEYAERDGSTYVGNEPFLSGYASGYTSTVAGGWENPPLLRKFHLADRQRDRYGANMALTPNEMWNLAVDYQRLKDDYLESTLGVSRSGSDIVSVDAGFVPSERWSVYAFAAREHLLLDQTGASIRAATRELDAVDPARYWTAKHRDDIDTLGAGLKFKLIEDRLDLSLDYLRAVSDSDIDVTVGSGLTTAPLPTDRTRLRSLSVQFDYRLREAWNLKLRWWNERYDSSSFAVDGVEANQLANVILLGETSPDYDVNFVSATFAYRF